MARQPAGLVESRIWGVRDGGHADVSVQNVVLGQLIQRRGYGYELIERLRAWSDAFELSGAAVYAALRQLERKGLVVEAGRGESHGVAGRQPAMRVIFEATDRGREHFVRWLATTPRKTPLREELHMQLIVAGEEDVPTLVEALTQMEADCREQLARVLAMSFDSAASPHVRISSFGAPLVLDGLASHLQCSMEWAQRTRRSLVNRQQAAASGRRMP